MFDAGTMGLGNAPMTPEHGRPPREPDQHRAYFCEPASSACTK